MWFFIFFGQKKSCDWIFNANIIKCILFEAYFDLETTCNNHHLLLLVKRCSVSEINQRIKVKISLDNKLFRR